MSLAGPGAATPGWTAERAARQLADAGASRPGDRRVPRTFLGLMEDKANRKWSFRLRRRNRLFGIPHLCCRCGGRWIHRGRLHFRPGPDDPGHPRYRRKHILVTDRSSVAFGRRAACYRADGEAAAVFAMPGLRVPPCVPPVPDVWDLGGPHRIGNSIWLTPDLSGLRMPLNSKVPVRSPGSVTVAWKAPPPLALGSRCAGVE